jgi:hypothetical protein
MVAIDQASQTLLDYVEERVERSKGRVLKISHKFRSKFVDVPCQSDCAGKGTSRRTVTSAVPAPRTHDNSAENR